MDTLEQKLQICLRELTCNKNGHYIRENGYLAFVSSSIPNGELLFKEIVHYIDARQLESVCD
jgi:hypothetical protein